MTSLETTTPPETKAKKKATPKKLAAKKPAKRATIDQLQAQADAIKAKSPSTSAAPLDADGFGSSLLRPLENTSPFGKVIFVGGAKAGKTASATRLCIGWHGRIESRRPIAVVDPEDALRFVRPLFDAAGVEVRRMASRSFADLVRFVREIVAVADVALIDNVSGFRDDLIEGYKRRTGIPNLGPADWQAINEQWRREFLSPLRRARFHAVLTGREADDYQTVFDGEGRHESVKVGTKLRAGNDTAYEADLIVHMERVEVAVVEGKPRFVRRAIVEDRADLIDGDVFDNPTFDNFRPFVDFVLAGAVAAVDVEEGSTAALFDGPQGSRHERRAVVDEIKAELDKLGNRRSPIVAAKRAAALNGSFRTSVWSSIELLDLDELCDGLDLLRQALADGGQTLIVGPMSVVSGAAAVAAVSATLADDAVAAAAVANAVDVVVARNRAVAAANSLIANLTEPHRSAAVDVVKAKKKSWSTPSGGAGGGSGGARPRAPSEP